MNMNIFQVDVFTKQAESEYNLSIVFFAPRIPDAGWLMSLMHFQPA